MEIQNGTNSSSAQEHRISNPSVPKKSFVLDRQDKQTGSAVGSMTESDPAVEDGLDTDDVSLSFPQRLMEILDDESHSDVISWLPHGRGFVVFRKGQFEKMIMPRYFNKQSKFSSFTRKLNRWGFTRVSKGPESGAYFHHYFQRGDYRRCLKMSCQSTTTTKPETAAVLHSQASSQARAGLAEIVLYSAMRDRAEQETIRAPTGSVLDTQALLLHNQARSMQNQRMHDVVRRKEIQQQLLERALKEQQIQRTLMLHSLQEQPTPSLALQQQQLFRLEDAKQYALVRNHTMVAPRLAASSNPFDLLHSGHVEVPRNPAVVNLAEDALLSRLVLQQRAARSWDRWMM